MVTLQKYFMVKTMLFCQISLKSLHDMFVISPVIVGWPNLHLGAQW